MRRNRLSTRAAAVLLGLIALFLVRAVPAGSGHPAAPVPVAAAAAPVQAEDVSYPLDPEGDASAGPDQHAQFSWPAPGAITSPFGGGRNHPGIDIDGVTGDPVQAAGAGTVALAGMAPGYEGYGNLVLIDHGGGISTVYAHLSRVDVTMGQTVQQGQQLGAIGATGLAFGDHLHFEVRVANKPVDPVPWLPARA
jgi:murein DD-endopeptidase MepM/ murein hydrolase activator NlpD